MAGREDGRGTVRVLFVMGTRQLDINPWSSPKLRSDALRHSGYKGSEGDV